MEVITWLPAGRLFMILWIRWRKSLLCSHFCLRIANFFLNMYLTLWARVSSFYEERRPLPVPPIPTLLWMYLLLWFNFSPSRRRPFPMPVIYALWECEKEYLVFSLGILSESHFFIWWCWDIPLLKLLLSRYRSKYVLAKEVKVNVYRKRVVHFLRTILPVLVMTRSKWSAIFILCENTRSKYSHSTQEMFYNTLVNNKNR